ncbi:MAG TPA: hypothetical protein PLB55_15195, partial [Prosthecobacter sp.]|nr:hypothetical protein [Prosthecobacter sp.]
RPSDERVGSPKLQHCSAQSACSSTRHRLRMILGMKLERTFAAGVVAADCELVKLDNINE